MNRIFITGDTHGDYDYHKLTSSRFKEGKELTKEDYLIILGDFGFIWDVNKSGKQEANLLKWLTDKPWTTLFIDGNHENHTRLDALPTVEKFGSPVGKVNDSIFHLRRGYVYTIAKKTFFTFGGGFSIDKARRIEGRSWWARELPNEIEYKRGLDSLTKVENKVDYILTHTCSNKMFAELATRTNMDHKIKGEDQIRLYFDLIQDTVKFKNWYFGHFHYDYLSSDNWQVMYYLIKELI